MTQLTLEKLHHCQETLDSSSFDQFKIKHDAQVTQLHQQLLLMQKEKEELQKEIRELQEDNALLRSTTEERPVPLMMEEKEQEERTVRSTLWGLNNIWSRGQMSQKLGSRRRNAGPSWLN